MRLAFSKSFIQQPCNQSLSGTSPDHVEQMVMQLVKNVGIQPEQAKVQQDGTLQFSGLPNPKLHTLTLEAEKMGLSVRYSKQTIVEIC